jgi:hypothetical protein
VSTLMPMICKLYVHGGSTGAKVLKFFFFCSYSLLLVLLHETHCYWLFSYLIFRQWLMLLYSLCILI